jgi:hypothetical protein
MSYLRQIYKVYSPIWNVFKNASNNFSFQNHPSIGALASPGNCGIQKVFSKKKIAHPRIIGGETAGIGQFPWIANLVQGTPGLNNYRTICGGSLIGPRTVLTAAHCLFGKDGNTTLEQFIHM